jgi:peptidoglycan L-alanyl-D-glutamate endopeptidase CwlK
MTAFSKSSEDKLEQAHPLLRLLMHEAISESPVDFGISCSVRGAAEQDKCYAEGKSEAKAGQSPHNFVPSLAVDIFPVVLGRAVWNDLALFDKLLRHIELVAQELGIAVELGRDFPNFIDRPHIQIAKWRTHVPECKEAE